MLQILLISSLVLTTLFGAAGFSAAAPGDSTPGELSRQLNLQREQIQSSMIYELQNQVQEQLSLGPAANSTETTVQDCDGTPDRDQDRDQDQLHDRDQDRIHEVEADGIANQYRASEENRNGGKP
jgi:hypothetical protein